MEVLVNYRPTQQAHERLLLNLRGPDGSVVVLGNMGPLPMIRFLVVLPEVDEWVYSMARQIAQFAILWAWSAGEHPVSAMKTSWETETDRLVCRWSDVGERVPYNPPWIEDAARNVHEKNVSPLGPVFTRLSPFGGGQWYAPHHRQTQTQVKADRFR